MEAALPFAQLQLQRYYSLVTTFIVAGGHPVEFQITDAFADGQPVLLPRALNVPGLYYNLLQGTYGLPQWLKGSG